MIRAMHLRELERKFSDGKIDRVNKRDAKGDKLCGADRMGMDHHNYAPAYARWSSLQTHLGDERGL